MALCWACAEEDGSPQIPVELKEVTPPTADAAAQGTKRAGEVTRGAVRPPWFGSDPQDIPAGARVVTALDGDQKGNWRYPRAGWCPGAYVAPAVADVTAALQPGKSATFDFLVRSRKDSSWVEFDNTCRPDAETCQGCTLGTGCEYDGGRHTPPHEKVSVTLVLYP